MKLLRIAFLVAILAIMANGVLLYASEEGTLCSDMCKNNDLCSLGPCYCGDGLPHNCGQYLHGIPPCVHYPPEDCTGI
jgi:hypothetical protein